MGSLDLSLVFVGGDRGVIILQEANADGIIIRLVEQGVASFAIVCIEGKWAAIADRTSDRACANDRFARIVENADVWFAHPIWRKPSTKRTINIKAGE